MGNLKLELIEYSRQLYGGEGDEDDDNGDGAGGLELTPSHQLRRGTSNDPTDRQTDTYADIDTIQHTLFLFAAFITFLFLAFI